MRCKQCGGTGSVTVKGKRVFECYFCEGTGEVENNESFFKFSAEPIKYFKESNKLTYFQMEEMMKVQGSNISACISGKKSPFKMLGE